MSNPNTPQEPPAKVYGSIPFEHKVISRETLHPELQKLANRIAVTKNLERVACAVLATNFIFKDEGEIFSTAFIKISALIIPVSIGIMYLVNLHWKKHTPGHKDPEDDLIDTLLPDTKHKKILNFGLKFGYVAPIPSFYTRLLTYTAANKIKELMERGEWPFADPNHAKLLHDHDVGIFDNNMNLVLIKHPESIYNDNPVSGAELRAKKRAWGQWFQRPRFAINQVEKREQVKTPWLQKKLGYAGPAF